MAFTIQKTNTNVQSSKLKLLTSAVPFVLTMVLSSEAFAQNAVNTASVTVPAGVTDPVDANNSATDSDKILAPIIATDESGTATSGTAATPVADVTTGDTINGSPAVIGTNATISEVGTWPPGISLDLATGAVTTGISVTPGTYTVDYQVCDINDTSNCATATVTIVVSGMANVLTRPNTCGAFEHKGWVTEGGPFTGAGVQFGSGDPERDPYVYAGLTKDSDGRIVTYFGAPQETLDGDIPSTAGTDIVTTKFGDSGFQSEYHITTIRLDGAAGASETVTLKGTGASENTYYWIEDSSGNVIEKLPEFLLTTNAADGADLSVPITYPSDGVVYLYAAVFDATQYRSKITVTDYTCPSANLVTTKTLGSTDGTPEEGDEVTFLITVENEGPSEATSISLTDSLPTGMTYTSNVVSQGGYDDSTGLWTVGTLVKDGTATLSLKGTVDSGQGGKIITNVTTAAVSTDVPDPTTNGDDLSESVDVVKVITADDDIVSTPVDTTTAQTGVVNVLDGDTLNGAAIDPADVTLSSTDIPAGFTLNQDGTVDIAANTPSGTYTFTYKVCEDGVTPENCATATVEITVDGPITADNEVVATPVDTSTAQTGVVNVLDGDTLNGVQMLDADVTLSSSDIPPGFTLNQDGTVDVAANTPSGTYTFTYKVCEDGVTPENCATATVEITVVGPITADNEVVSTPIDTTTAQTGVVNVLDGDTLNGMAIDPADVTLSSADIPAGFTLNQDGTVDIAANTPSGTYTFTYKVCEDGVTPENCATATVTITVDGPITADDETVTTPVDTTTDQTAVVNVLDGDTLNGVQALDADVTLVPLGTLPAGFTLNQDGTVDVAANTPSGTYSFDYKICEDGVTPENCATATVEITVVGPITADDDIVSTSVDTTTAQTGVVNVLDGDTLNGAAIDPADVTLSSTDIPAGFTLNQDGTVDIAANTPSGTYTFTYKVCEDGVTPENCATATVEITVVGPITADDDIVSSSVDTTTAQTGVVNVLDGDTLNGAAIDPADVTLSSTDIPAGFTLNQDGTVDIAANTPSGTYTFTYKVCEDGVTPENCATATVTITVDGPITAKPEIFPPVNGADGGTTSSVLASDTLNGVAVNPADVTLTAGAITGPDGTPSTTLVLNADGTITIAPGTPAGDYSVTYEICEKANPDNCATITETVTVEAPSVEAGDDAVTGVNGTDGAEGVVNVFANDTLNGQPIDPNAVTLTETVADPEGVLTLNPDGTVDVAPGSPAGTYELTYEICETLNPTNCTTATVTVTVVAAPIEATPDTVSGIDSTTGGTNVVNVLDGDTLNGVPVTPETVTVAIAPGTTLPTGITLNPDGSIDVGPETAEGTYVVEYQVCEILNPTNCTTSTATIIIDPPVASLSGIVYLDANSNGQRDSDEQLLTNWVVEILDADGNIIATVTTDENGYYEQADLPVGEYSVVFRNPENNAVYGSIKGVQLNGGDVVVDQNLPIDPSGVVYDSLTRVPVEGTLVTFVDANGNPLPEVCFIDPSQQNQITDSMGMYRFDLVPGADVSCPVGQTNYNIIFDAPESHFDTNSTVIGVQPGFLSAPAGTGPFLVSPLATAPQAGDDTTYYLGFTLGTGSRDVINNHIPIDPITLMRSPLDVVKTSDRKDVNFGDLVPYTITVTNTEDIPRVDLDIIDFTPPGFKYVEDSSRLNGVDVDPEVNGRELILNDYDFAPNETKVWTMMMVVGAGVGDGIYTNQAYVRDPLGEEVSRRAEAVVRVSPDPLFDCSELIGKVYDDKNRNGYQDKGEPGLAGVRLATAKGLLVTTDDKGRYHITCAAIPNGQIGSNFILKVDGRTLPTGYHITSENPRVVRLTRGKLSKANFGASLENVVTLDVSDAAFEAGSNTLKSEFSGQLGQIIDALKGQESTLRLTYYSSVIGRDERLDELSGQIQELWEVYGGDYDLNIERKTVRPDGNTTLQNGAGE